MKKKKKAAMMSSPNILAASFHFLTFFLLFTFFTSMDVMFTHHHSINYLQWQTKQNPILPLQLFLCFFFLSLFSHFPLHLTLILYVLSYFQYIYTHLFSQIIINNNIHYLYLFMTFHIFLSLRKRMHCKSSFFHLQCPLQQFFTRTSHIRFMNVHVCLKQFKKTPRQFVWCLLWECHRRILPENWLCNRSSVPLVIPFPVHIKNIIITTS